MPRTKKVTSSIVVNEKKPRAKRRTKEEMIAFRAKKILEKYQKQLNKEAKQNEKPDFQCCREIGANIEVTHDLKNKDLAVETKKGLMCANCFNIFKRTSRGVDWYNSMYALPGQEIELDEELAKAFQYSKANQVEEERSVVRTRRK